MLQTDQNKEVLEEAKRRMQESRKKVSRFNILLSLLVCTIIIGLAGIICNYDRIQKLYQEKKELSDKLKTAASRDSVNTATIESQKNYNQYTLTRIQQSVDEGKTKINDTSLAKLLNLVVADPTPPPQDPLQTNSRDSARAYSEEGYRKLRAYNFPAALTAFDKSEKALNGYRESYEIYYLLWKNRKNFNDPVVQKMVMLKILNNYNSKNILKPSDIR